MVYLGTISRNLEGHVEFSEEDLPLKYTRIHEQYDPVTFWNDIGLIYLKSATPNILKKPNIALIALPKKSDASKDFVGTMATLSGFGVSKDGG